MTDQTDNNPEHGSRIDYIFSVAVSGHSHPAIGQARVVLNQPTQAGVYPSDHFGVMVQMQLTNGNP